MSGNVHNSRMSKVFMVHDHVILCSIYGLCDSSPSFDLKDIMFELTVPLGTKGAQYIPIAHSPMYLNL